MGGENLRAVCIIGSPHSYGSTGIIIDSLVRGLKENDFTIKRYCLGESNINYCLGCKQCYINGECCQNDDVKSIVSDMLNADLVVIGTPSYWGNVTGQLKVFFDRSTPYGDTNRNRKLIHTQKIYGVSISVRAGSTDRENIKIHDEITHYFGHLGIDVIERISLRETDTVDDLLLKHQDKIEEAYLVGKKIKELIRTCD